MWKPQEEQGPARDSFRGGPLSSCLPAPSSTGGTPSAAVGFATMQAFRIFYMVIGAAWIILATVTIIQGSMSPNLVLQLAVGAGLVWYGWNRHSKQREGR